MELMETSHPLRLAHEKELMELRLTELQLQHDKAKKRLEDTLSVEGDRIMREAKKEYTSHRITKEEWEKLKEEQEAKLIKVPYSTRGRRRGRTGGWLVVLARIRLGTVVHASFVTRLRTGLCG